MSLWQQHGEPYWPFLIALGAVAGLYYALPKQLSIGPPWLLAAVLAILVTIAVFAHTKGADAIGVAIGISINSIVTAALFVSLALLVESLPSHRVEPLQLLLSAGSLWICNVLVFAAWYWRLDAGGPHRRAEKVLHDDGAFLFPQMAIHPELQVRPESWRPNFVDYLFLAFNTSTALSPTDTQVLSRWAKALMMLQSFISLAIIVLLAARAVNIL
jgi:hypothetical protein